MFLNRENYSYKIFILITLAVLTAVSGIIGLIYYLEAKNERNTVIVNEGHLLEMIDERIQDAFKVVFSDIEMIMENAKNHAKDGFFNPESIADDLFAIVKSRKVYDQIRFLDDPGMEIVRVDYNNGEPRIKDKDNLQFKGNRYYFKNTIELERGDVYISPMDLNMENGRIERPLKPIVRFGVPIFNNSGQKTGILVLNYLSLGLLDRLEKLRAYEYSPVSVLNSDGYWLKSGNVENEWGFMYEDKQGVSFKNQYPRIWQKIRTNAAGSVKADSGEYIFKTIYPLSFKDSNKNYYWHVVSFVPKNMLTAKSQALLYNLISVSLIFLVIIIIFVWILAGSISKKKQAENRVIQLNDLLKVVNKILRHDILNRLTPIKLAFEAYRDYKETSGFENAEEALNGGIKLIGEMKRLEELAVTGNSLKSMQIRDVVSELTREYEIPIEIQGNAKVMADSALRSVFDNIIRNAIIHGQTKTIKIIIKKEKRRARIEIIDRGRGIPEEIRNKIFKEGFIYGKTGGTGLGLYIVKKTIERYGGEIEVTSNKSGGAIFIIKLPGA